MRRYACDVLECAGAHSQPAPSEKALPRPQSRALIFSSHLPSCAPQERAAVSLLKELGSRSSVRAINIQTLTSCPSERGALNTVSSLSLLDDSQVPTQQPATIGWIDFRHFYHDCLIGPVPVHRR